MRFNCGGLGRVAANCRAKGKGKGQGGHKGGGGVTYGQYLKGTGYGGKGYGGGKGQGGDGGKGGCGSGKGQDQRGTSYVPMSERGCYQRGKNYPGEGPNHLQL